MMTKIPITALLKVEPGFFAGKWIADDVLRALVKHIITTEQSNATALDAERYRWLRDKGRLNGVRVEEQRAHTVHTHASSTLDTLIDEFLKLEKKS